VHNGSLRFENPHLWVELSPEMEIQKMELKEAFEDSQSLRKAAEMAVIYGGLVASTPFLLLGR
jgi:hypothetical protein